MNYKKNCMETLRKSLQLIPIQQKFRKLHLSVHTVNARWRHFYVAYVSIKTSNKHNLVGLCLQKKYHSIIIIVEILTPIQHRDLASTIVSIINYSFEMRICLILSICRHGDSLIDNPTKPRFYTLTCQADITYLMYFKL